MYSVYAYGDSKSYLLVDHEFWVINGDWQIKREDGKFFCVAPHATFQIDIHLAGYIDYDGDYNSTLERFRNGEGKHLNAIQEPIVEVISSPTSEFCKKKYYGIECDCSKCKR